MRNYRAGTPRWANWCYLQEGANRLSDLPGQPAAIGIPEAWPARNAQTFLISTRRPESERRIPSTAFNNCSEGSTVRRSPHTPHSEELWSYYFQCGNAIVPLDVAYSEGLFDQEIFPITILVDAREVQDVVAAAFLISFGFLSSRVNTPTGQLMRSQLNGFVD